MKHLLPVLLLICSNAFSQKIVIDKTDEFTGKRVKETSVENLAQPLKMSGFSYKFSFKKVDENVYLGLKIMSLSNSVFAVKDGDVLLLKTEDTVITLSNAKYEVSTRGGAGGGLSSGNSQGVSLYFPLREDAIKAIKNNGIVKLRLYTTDGYSEQEIKPAADKKVKTALALIN